MGDQTAAASAAGQVDGAVRCRFSPPDPHSMEGGRGGYCGGLHGKRGE